MSAFGPKRISLDRTSVLLCCLRRNLPCRVSAFKLAVTTRMGAQATWISHSASEEIKIKAPRVIDRPQRSGLQCAFGERVSRMASRLDRAGPSNGFIDKALERDNPIDDPYALGTGEVIDLPEEGHLVGRWSADCMLDDLAIDSRHRYADRHLVESELKIACCSDA